MTNDGGGSGAPRFDVVLRGYDRRQVDEHVARMQRIIGRMRADLELARSQPLPIVAPAQAGIPASDQNGRSARSRPGGSPDVVGSFTDRMQSILQSAEEEAAEIRKKAHASARSELQAARAEVADLARQRDVMVTELNRLRGQLESMLSAPTAKMAPVATNGSTPSPARRDGKPRPSPKPRPGAPSPVARQAATGPQPVSPPKPPASDPSVTAAAPAVPDEPPPAPEAATNGASRNGGGEQASSPSDSPPTTVVQVTKDTRAKAVPAKPAQGKPAPAKPGPAKPGRANGGEERPPVDATVRVAAVRPDGERGEKAKVAPEAEMRSSRSG
ncbi:hypothetical protein ACQEVB_09310 [Pseudonocardia sp. CA-107938]|uniref:hypothetical protein n=1 Tax=Pseudonocardia sp. CA-107938 TaxID=3240021 RepID=UPI003D8FD8F1